MTYLDVNPMITALRTSPDNFEFTSGSLHHIPSRHRFQFTPGGSVLIDAQCDCSHLAVEKNQEMALHEAFNTWRTNYWAILQINKEFAGHFAEPTGFRRLLIDLTARLHSALLRQGHRTPHYTNYKVPAE
jgi:hypothetical protein